ncbi:unnamed protein product [Moneuplotes crassus]|uniref:Uncharacterized protein n=1 Tax=Euplotes crassus TaxID=5936 RepID=A0AAD1XIS3_EUPCR|nr:unnamed protein product [Moneuplotes crassus]
MLKEFRTKKKAFKTLNIAKNLSEEGYSVHKARFRLCIKKLEILPRLNVLKFQNQRKKLKRNHYN